MVNETFGKVNLKYEFDDGGALTRMTGKAIVGPLFLLDNIEYSFRLTSGLLVEGKLYGCAFSARRSQKFCGTSPTYFAADNKFCGIPCSNFVKP